MNRSHERQLRAIAKALRATALNVSLCDADDLRRHALALEAIAGTSEQPTADEPDYGGVLGADNQVYSDADPGL